MLNSPTSRPGAGLLAGLVLLASLSVSCAQRPETGTAAGPTPTPAASPIPWATIQPPAQVSLPAGTPQTQPRSAVRTFSGVGVIRSINLKEGWFEIDHEEIAGFMPAMQMQWSVKPVSMLKPLNVGDRVNFTVADDNGSEVVTEIKRAPAAP